MKLDAATLTVGSGPIEHALLVRIKAAYRTAIAAQSSSDAEGMWSGLNARKQDVHAALLAENDQALARILARPGDGDLFCGFENCYADCVKIMRGLNQEVLKAAAHTVYTDLVLLAESVGARRRRNPEQPNAPGALQTRLEIDELLSDIEKAIDCPLLFPNPFPDEFGVQTRAGLISYRAEQAIYQAWRVKQLAGKYGGRVVEIGAGLGRTAYYAKCMGITEYTVVDLPITGVAQSAFLGSVLRGKELSLTGEPDQQRAVRVIAPEQLFAENRQYDVVVNADALTEMPLDVAERYANFARQSAKVLLSINHEFNAFTVKDLAVLAGTQVSRHPYWMRDGYVEELFAFS